MKKRNIFIGIALVLTSLLFWYTSKNEISISSDQSSSEHTIDFGKQTIITYTSNVTDLKTPLLPDLESPYKNVLTIPENTFDTDRKHMIIVVTEDGQKYTHRFKHISNQ